jgi:acetylornithine/succinyldiaminopimelate/putrescine aminotransferase
MLTHPLYNFGSKKEDLDASIRFWNPGKTRFWQDAGVDLVMGRREGYVIHDIDGRRLIDLHINGGTYNLGHRNPELISTLKDGLDQFDIGNHWFPSITRAAFAEAMVKLCPGMRYAVFSTGGAEAVEVALKSARYATKRRRIVSIVKGYHGHSGLSVATGDERFSKIFLSDRPGEFAQVPFNDEAAMAAALAPGDVAAVIMETIPATYGFPMPHPGYLPAVKALAAARGTLYIADEVQTGLMRCGPMWGYQAFGVVPDIVVTAKGISGGIYPISVTLLDDRAGGWLHEDGAAHISTTGGSELGCLVGLKVLEILARPETRANDAEISAYFTEAFAGLIARHGDLVTGLRQQGVVMGVEFAGTDGAMHASRALYENGVWAIFSSLDKRVLQFKPGALMPLAQCQEVMQRFEASLPRLRDLIRAAA